MSNEMPSTIAHAAPTSLDSSVSYEALGFLNPSYDLIDGLLREVVKSDHAHPDVHTSATELTLIGQPDGLAPLGHLFL